MNFLPFFVFVACITLLRLFSAERLELIPDEAYYWQWSRHLSWSYFDHPPITAWLIATSTGLGKVAELWIRLPAVLLGLGLSGVTWLLGQKLFFENDKAGWYSVVLMNLILIFALGFIIITPDTPLVFFWALALYFLYEATFSGKTSCWYYMGITLGFALLSKYTAILLIPCLGIFLGFSHSFRHYIHKKEPYLAILLAFFIFSPVLFWNATHDWVSFRFQLTHGFSGKLISPFIGLFSFLGSQILVITPFVFAALTVAMVYCYRFWEKEKDDRFLFLFSFSVPVFLFFGILSFKTKIEGNWPVVAYISGTLALAGLYTTRWEIISPGQGLRFLKKWTLFTVALIFVSVHLQTLWRVFPLAPQWDMALKRAYGWKLLGEYVGTIYHDLDGATAPFIFAHRHNIASELAFYIPGKPQAYRSHGKQRYSFLGNLDHLIGKNGIYVVQSGRGELKEIKKHFDSVEELNPLPIIIHGKLLRTFRIFRCINYRGGLIEV